MANQEYNGWTNYETWCVNLWLGNDQGSDEYWRERAQTAWDESETETSFTRAERATLTLSDSLKDEIEQGASERISDASLYSDLLSAAISEVNWYEIAEHFISDVDQTCEESDEYDDLIETRADMLDMFLADAQKHIEPFRGDSSAWSQSFDTLAHARYLLEKAGE